MKKSMKKSMKMLTILSVLLLAGCAMKDADSSEPKVIRDASGFLSTTTIQNVLWEGHTFILVQARSPAFLHHPGCPCQK